MTSLSAQAIYDNFHAQAQGTSGLARGQQCAQQLAVNLQDRAVAAQTLVNGIHAGWRGSAAEAAAQGLTPFAVNTYENHQGFGSGQGIVSNQMDAFQSAASEVQPVPPAPQMQDVLFAVTNGGPDLAPMQAQFAHYNAVQQANVDAYNKYVAASQANSDMPSIMPVAASDAPVSVVAPQPGSALVNGSLGGQPYAGPSHARSARAIAPASATRLASAGSGGSLPFPSSAPTPVSPGGPSSSTAPSTAPTGPVMPVTPGGSVGPSGSVPPGGSVGPVGPVLGLGTTAPGDDGDSNLGSRQPGNELPGLVFGWGPPAEGEFSAGGGSMSYRGGVGGGSIGGARVGAPDGWAEGSGGSRSAAGMEGGASEKPAGVGEQTVPQEVPPGFAPIAAGRDIHAGDERDHRRTSHEDEGLDDEMWGIVDEVAPSVIGAHLPTPIRQ